MHESRFSCSNQHERTPTSLTTATAPAGALWRDAAMGTPTLIPLVLLAWLAGSCSGLQVVSLDTGSFEHQTQAATGQTTGHW